MSGCWVEGAGASGFGVDNLPYGIFSTAGRGPRAGVAIGPYVLDVSALGAPHSEVLAAPTLNPFMTLGPRAWGELRQALQQLLCDEGSRPTVEPHLVPLDEVRMHLPFAVADYVDFYSSEHHATTVGRIFRPGGEALTPNWKHVPIGYHGRAGTVVVSGTDVVRPWGQTRPDPSAGPVFGPSRRLDLEAEVGFVVGVGSPAGRVAPDDLDRHVFGVVLVNDWSARDLQSWEYVPLGPFLGKSFATSISAWVVPLAALQSARRPTPAQDPEPLAYLRGAQPWGLDIDLEVEVGGVVVSRPPFREMYWTAAQQLAHLTVNGASLRTGDLFASGTVSGPGPGERGCLLELTWDGRDPIELGNGLTRTFLEDGDEVRLRASAPGPEGSRISLGDVVGRVVSG